jgi:hypothetical protein
MAHDRLVSIRTVPGCIGVGEAIKGVAVASFEGVKPSLLDQKAQADMIELNQGTNAGEIKADGSNGVPEVQAAKATAWAAPYS